jgi:hypothetical protein
MQIVNCTVAIAGEAGMTVYKERVSVPEILVLRAIHGEDAVRNIEVIEDVEAESNEERARLTSIYKMPEGVVKDTLGAVGPLPKTVEDSGIGDEFVISNTVTKTKRAKKASAVEELSVKEEAAPAAE